MHVLREAVQDPGRFQNTQTVSNQQSTINRGYMMVYRCQQSETPKQRSSQVDRTHFFLTGIYRSTRTSPRTNHNRVDNRGQVSPKWRFREFSEGRAK